MSVKLVVYLFRIIRQIPRCVLTWVMVIVAFCYDVLCEPCDGFSDLLSVLLEFLCYAWGFAFLVFGSLSGLDLSCLCLGFQERQFYLSGGFSELVRWVGGLFEILCILAFIRERRSFT